MFYVWHWHDIMRYGIYKILSQTICCKNGTRCRIPTNIEMYGCVLHWTVHTCNLYYVSIITSITGEHNNGSKTINTPHTHNMKHDYIPNIQHCSRTIYNMAQNSFVTEIKMQTLFVFFNPIRHWGGGGGSKCPDQFHFTIVMFFSRKHAIKLVDFS